MTNDAHPVTDANPTRSETRDAGERFARWRIGSLPVIVLALLVLAYLAFVLFAPKPPPKPDATWTRMQQEGIVRIGVDPSSPPFVEDDGKGNLSGFDVALAKELAAQWGVKTQYVYTGYDGLYDALNSGQFDLILSALPYNPLKTQDVNFSQSYFNGGPVLVVRGEDTTTAGLESLQAQPIAVELGSNGDAVARKWQRLYSLQLRQLDSSVAALQALQNRQVAAAIVDPITLYDFQRAASDPTVAQWRVVGKPLAAENYVIAVRKNSPTLLSEINRVLDALKQSGQLEELQKENF